MYSIIIPAHNSEKTIQRCLVSILHSQCNEPYEVLVVDDGSQDSTAKIAESLGVKVIICEHQGGPSMARNRGAGYAAGDTLIFVDSDILWPTDTLQKIHEFFCKEKEYAGVTCNFAPRCEMKDALSRYKHLYMCLTLQSQPRSMTWAFTPTFAIKKNVFESAGRFNEGVTINEDELLGRKILSKGYRIAFGRDIPVQHLHRYPLLHFIKNEFRKTRAGTIVKLTMLFRFKKMLIDDIAPHMANSIFIFPFFATSLFLVHYNVFIFIIMLAVFYITNLHFLRFCGETFGLLFMLKAVFVIPFDCLISYAGICAGFLEFLKGKRL